MAKSIEERLAEAQKKLEKLKADKAKMDARQKVIESQAKRRLDNRKKMLIGACFLHLAEKSEETNSKMLVKLNAFLKRPAEREIFGLPPLPKSQDAAIAPAAS